MRVEPRGRATRTRAAVNRQAERAGERVEALRDPEGGREGGVPEGQSQQGGAGSRRGVDQGVREEPGREPLQALESDVLGELLPAAGPSGRDTKTGRARGSGPGGAHRGRQDRSDGREAVPGAGSGANLPRELIWVPAGAVGAGRGRGLPGAVLED